MKDGDLTFVSGHPGGTSRGLTVAELEYQRDVALPERLLALSRDARHAHRVPEPRRRAEAHLHRHPLRRRERAQGAQGPLEALLDHDVLRPEGRRRSRSCAPRSTPTPSEEGSLRRRLGRRSPRPRSSYARCAKQAVATRSTARASARSCSASPGRWCAAATSCTKPNAQRLREYADSNLPALKQQLFSPAPIYDELEIARLTFSPHQAARGAGRGRPVREEGARQGVPAELATRAGQGHQAEGRGGAPGSCSRAARRRSTASKRSDDRAGAAASIPTRAPSASSTRTRSRRSLKKNSELIAKARFDVYGTSIYPDATFTLRLSYGAGEGLRRRTASR